MAIVKNAPIVTGQIFRRSGVSEAPVTSLKISSAEKNIRPETIRATIFSIVPACNRRLASQAADKSPKSTKTETNTSPTECQALALRDKLPDEEARKNLRRTRITFATMVTTIVFSFRFIAR